MTLFISFATFSRSILLLSIIIAQSLQSGSKTFIFLANSSFSHLYLSLSKVRGVAQTAIVPVLFVSDAGLTAGSMPTIGTLNSCRSLVIKLVVTVLQATTIIRQP